MKLTAAPAGADGQRRTAAADAITVPAGRRAARASTGLWAGIVLAAFAGAALTGGRDVRHLPGDRVAAHRGQPAMAVRHCVGSGRGHRLFGIPAAILRHRLYDIDRIISRTLEYAIVTGLLVGVYAGLVLLATQALPVSLSTPVAVAVATLAAAALFSPLRRRVQRAVDRRFNRARYDAESTVAAFAARLKDTVDLDSVRDDLAGVVHQALEPAHVSVWIRQHD